MKFSLFLAVVLALLQCVYCNEVNQVSFAQADAFDPTRDCGSDDSSYCCDVASSSAYCCLKIEAGRIIDGYACANVTYVASADDADIKVTWKDKTVYQGSINISDPKPVCFSVLGAKFCVDLTNIAFTDYQLDACITLSITLVVNLGTFTLGCFKIFLKH